MDDFFDQEVCDRCGESLENGQIMSMFNTQTICMSCKREEERREDYQKALEEVRRQESLGNRDFEGIGL